MKKYAFIIDIESCENCNNCFLSCKDEHCGNTWPGYNLPQPLHGHRWMNIQQKERGAFPLIDVAYLPKPCMHCDEAPCVAAGKGSVTKREDGIVLIDPEKSRDRMELVESCPYGSIWWNEEERLPQKCSLCAHLLDEGWQAPRCVQSCPTGALNLFYGDEAELEGRIVEEGLQRLPEASSRGSQPRCYYKNLYRYTHCFIAGSLARTDESGEECVVGARVLLRKGPSVIAEQESDDFGDFKFDGLEPDSGEYLIEILVNGQMVKQESLQLTTSRSAGTIMLE